MIFFFLTGYFGDTYCLIYKKSNLFVYIYCQIFQTTRQDMPYKPENWHYFISNEQYFLKKRFLDICRSAFKVNVSRHIAL